MSEEEKSEKGEFRVVDKRRFTSDGDAKESEESRVVRTESVEPRPATSSSSLKNSVREREASVVEPGSGPEALDFSSLIVSLATQALMLMGEVPGHESNPEMMNLDAAKQTVDVLGLLEIKTKGNLSPDEQKLLSEILASLRLAFVKRSEKK